MAVALALLATTAALISAALGLEGVSFLLGGYLAAWSECVLLGESLSPLHQIGRPGYAGGELVALAAAFAFWRLRGRQLPRVPRPQLATLRRYPLLTCFSFIIVCALAYEAFIAFTTPPDNTDALTYHLPRAVEWLNLHSLSYFPATTARENAFPLNAELGVLFTFVFSGRDTFAALPQFASELAILAAVYGCARRLGYAAPGALFAGLLTLTLSEISLEAVTAQNDLVVAAFLAAAAFFVLGTERPDRVLAALSTGLAVGTKLTALFALPILALLALAAIPRRRLPGLVALTLVAFALVGAWSYVDNFLQTGHPLGVVPEDAVFSPTVTALGTVSTVARIYYRFIDFSGVPVSSLTTQEIARVGSSLFSTFGIPASAPGSTFHDSFSFWPDTGSDEDSSYFGLLGVLLVIPLSLGATIWGIRRHARVVLVLGLALPIFTIALAFANSFNPWLGRFMTAPVVLTMPLAASLYGRRATVAPATLALVGIVTLAFTQAYSLEKPTGVTANSPAIWSMSRLDAETFDAPLLGQIASAIGRRVPAKATLGLDIVPGSIVFPLYGPTLERTLVPLPARDPLAAAETRGLRWVVVDAAHRLAVTRAGWHSAPLPAGWELVTWNGPQKRCQTTGSTNVSLLSSAPAGRGGCSPRVRLPQGTS